MNFRQLVKWRRLAALATFTVVSVTQLSGQEPRTISYIATADSIELLSQTEIVPANDAVLTESPSEVTLHFPMRVRLVKFVLRDHDHQWVDINFRYNPRSSQDYRLELPELEESLYYTVEWAILTGRDQLVRGSNSFAVGLNARPPSEYFKEEQEQMNMRMTGDPNVREVTPPRTQIIIERDEPAIDPPFTIRLDQNN